MRPSRPELELLAPAQNADIGIAAINHGADAVYIGGPAYGARVNASNEIGDIERLVRHAHRYGARIFVTLNTILRDDELEPARRMIHQLYDSGVDALIVQDMGLLELDLPPLQLHASTQTDIRTPEKARFLQDVGFSQMVLARELTLQQIRMVAAEVQEATLEFFIHGALCVAYSGQCYVSHAQTGRSANRGDCSQACRLPYTVTDAQGRVVAHDKHVLSMKDNDQTENLEALVDAGIRSFKIEGRYKDMGYVKNVTSHYRQRIDAMLEARSDLRPASSGRCAFFFTPNPSRNFHRGRTDYFVNGRTDDIGAFDSPKYAGLPIGHVVRVGFESFDIGVDAGVGDLHNGDGLTYYDLQQELIGVPVNKATRVSPEGAVPTIWRVEPNEPVSTLPGLKANVNVSRNRDMSWLRTLEGKTVDRRIAVDWQVTQDGDALVLHLSDREGHKVSVAAAQDYPPADNAERAAGALREGLAKLGATIFQAGAIDLAWQRPRFIPASAANAWRRDAVEKLETLRLASLPRLPRAAPAEPPARYPADSLSYLGNVANQQAAAFYARHGVQVVEAAYESHQELGDVSLMITKHCVRFSLSLCPKQAKGVTGVQGTVRAEPMTLINGKERLSLVFDCKACEMHVVGRMKKSILASVPAVPVAFQPRAISRPPDRQVEQQS
jgi:putative protease